MNEQNTELYYAKNIAKQRKWQRNIFIGLFSFMTILFIISATALGLACKDDRQKLSFYLDPDYTAHWGGQQYENINIKICFFYIFPIIRLLKKI